MSEDKLQVSGEIVNITGMDKHYDRPGNPYTFYQIEIDNGKIGQNIVVNQTRSMFPKEPEIGDKVTVYVEFNEVED